MSCFELEAEMRFRYPAPAQVVRPIALVMKLRSNRDFRAGDFLRRAAEQAASRRRLDEVAPRGFRQSSNWLNTRSWTGRADLKILVQVPLA